MSESGNIKAFCPAKSKFISDQGTHVFPEDVTETFPAYSSPLAELMQSVSIVN